MALNEHQKKIIGLMLDTGFIRGSVREQVASDDKFARQQIRQFKKNMRETIKRKREDIAKQRQKIEERRAKIDALQDDLIEMKSILDADNED